MMNKKLFELASVVAVLVLGLVFMTAFAFAGEKTPKGNAYGWHGDRGHSIQLGPRPYF
nr:hypothetical protein [Desulfobacterales bacterium]